VPRFLVANADDFRAFAGVTSLGPMWLIDDDAVLTGDDAAKRCPGDPERVVVIDDFSLFRLTRVAGLMADDA
jgi:hypothetical protein